MFRQNSILLSDEVYWYARVKAKQLVKGTEAAITVDEFVDGELRNLFTTNDPELVIAWEQHCQARQKAKKEYDRIENEAVGLSAELEHREYLMDNKTPLVPSNFQTLETGNINEEK